VLCETGCQHKNRWPKAFQAYKGEEKEMRLDQDKMGILKAKEGMSITLCMGFVVDRIRSLLK
jgi:hypothetical protein